MVYVLKFLGLASLWAATELWLSGHIWWALAAVPTLVTLWWVTREYGRRGDP